MLSKPLLAALGGHLPLALWKLARSSDGIRQLQFNKHGYHRELQVMQRSRQA